MNTRRLRGIAGPVGRLEALLEPPALTAGERLRAAVVFAHPHPLFGGTMHTKGVYRATKALAGLGLRGAPVQLPWASGRATACSTTPSASSRTSGPVSTSWRHGIPASSCGRRGSRSAPTLRSRRARATTASRRSSASPRRSRCTTSPKYWRAANRSTSFRASATRFARSRTWRRSSRSCRSRSGSWWCLARTTCSTARLKTVARAITEMFATPRGVRHKTKGKVTCTMQSSSRRCGRPSARRLPARFARPGLTRWGRSCCARRSHARLASIPRRWTT